MTHVSLVNINTDLGEIDRTFIVSLQGLDLFLNATNDLEYS